MNVQDLLNRIDALVKERGMSKEEFYSKSGISSATFSQWNTGKFKPSIKKIKAAASVLGVSYSYLVSGEENEKTASPTADGLSEYDIKALAWFHSLSSEKRKAILSLADGPEELAELPDRE